MKETLLALLLISVVLALPHIPTNSLASCSSSAKNVLNKFEAALAQEKPNSIIDGITQTMQSAVPIMLTNCFGQKVSDMYSNQLPPVCITDMGKAAKILVRMVNQTDNDFKFSLDAALFERIYQTKLKKQCPILDGTTIQQIKSGGVCMQASYQFSLLIQKIGQDMRKGDRKTVLVDIDNIMSTLPDLLDACGESKWADDIRKFAPMNCVHALQDFGVELAEVQHNYMHFEWLATHYKDIITEYGKVRQNCPLLI